MGDWARGNGNFRIISDNNIEKEITELLGKPFTFDEMLYGNVTKDRYEKIPYSCEGSIMYNLHSFKIKDKRFSDKKSYVGKWLTEIKIYGYLRNGNDGKNLEEWILQLINNYKIYDDNWCNYNNFKWKDDFSPIEDFYFYSNGEFFKGECNTETDDVYNYKTWNGSEWIDDENKL